MTYVTDLEEQLANDPEGILIGELIGQFEIRRSAIAAYINALPPKDEYDRLQPMLEAIDSVVTVLPQIWKNLQQQKEI